MFKYRAFEIASNIATARLKRSYIAIDRNITKEKNKMPGSVSDSYHPEFSTGENAYRIKEALQELYDYLTIIVLDGEPPKYILDVLDKRGSRICADLWERQWRLIRFALERANESI